MNIALRTAVALLPLLSIAAPPAGATGLNVTCKANLAAANVIPNRHVPDTAVIYGADLAYATVVCVSLTGDSYLAWVDLAIYDATGDTLVHQYGEARASTMGLALAYVGASARGYDDGSSAAPREHRAIAWAIVAPPCWPSCPAEVKDTVIVTFPT